MSMTIKDLVRDPGKNPYAVSLLPVPTTQRSSMLTMLSTMAPQKAAPANKLSTQLLGTRPAEAV